MSGFTYRAINELGRTVTGVVEAGSLEEANEAVSMLGHIPTSVHARGRSLAFSREFIQRRFMSVHPYQLILFTKQLATMIRTGVPITRCMHILGAQTENAKLRYTVSKIGEDLQAGVSLSSSFRRFPEVFSPLYTSMVYAGESSGSLPAVLDRLVYITEHEYKIRSDIRSALNYPMIVVGCLACAFVVLLHFVIPKFASVFARTKLELPMPTRVCVRLSYLLDHYWLGMLGVGAAIILLLGAVLRTDRGRYVRDYLLLRIPLIGPVLIKAAISRFASIFAILQETGVAILESMNILSGTIGNEAFAREIHTVQELLEEGHGIARPLNSSRYFTPMLLNMVAIGEEAGTLDEMLREVSKHYDTEVEFAMKRMSEAIGPILIIMLSAVVGFFALAIYMPMWDLTKLAG
jgi:type II secretory pathway component PulF